MRRHGWRALATTAVVALGAIGMGTPTAVAADTTIPAVGVNDIRSDGILLPNMQYDGSKDLDLLAQSGVTLYRSRVRMDCVVRPDGSFDFKTPSAACWGLSYDNLVKALAQRGITLLPSLMNFRKVGLGEAPAAPTVDGADGTPTWDRFAAFAGAAARRYGAGGTFWNECGCPARPIRSWEIWNEQNNGWWWNGKASADEYAEVFHRTRAALRGADAGARAVVGGVVWDRNGESSFVEPETMIARLARDDANAFDAVAIHPYTDARGRDGATLAADALAFTRLMADIIVRATGPSATGGPRQPIWLTEMGWSDADGTPQAIADGIAHFTAALDNGARQQLNVGPVLWFMLRDAHVLHARDDRLGLRRTTTHGGDAGAKPAWNTFVAAAQRTPGVTLPDALGAGQRYHAPRPTVAVEAVPQLPEVAPAPAPVALPKAKKATAKKKAKAKKAVAKKKTTTKKKAKAKKAKSKKARSKKVRSKKARSKKSKARAKKKPAKTRKVTRA